MVTMIGEGLDGALGRLVEGEYEAEGHGVEEEVGGCRAWKEMCRWEYQVGGVFGVRVE